MPHISLTQLGAERLRAQPKETVYWDKTLPGFGLRVSPKGRKSFVCQYRVRGTRGSKWVERQVVLGTLAFLTVAEARDRARRYKAKASEGVDPVEETRAAKQAEENTRTANALTFAKLVERYEVEHLVKRKPAGAAEQMRLFKRWLPRLGDKPVADICEGDILAFVNELLKGRANGRNEADHLVGVVRHLFSWAKKHHDPDLKNLIHTNPAIEIARRSDIQSRDRFLSHDEIRKLWTACDTISWPGGQILKLLLATAQRVNEVGEMRWSELDLANRVWNLPAARAKNSRAHIIHLSDLAMEIIDSLPHIDNSDLVFTIDGRIPCSSIERHRSRVHDLMGKDIPYFQLRDLRRTACTLMAEIGIDHHIADKVLNHTSGQISGVAAVYNRYQYLDQRKQALDALGKKIEQLIRRAPDNVIPIRA
jgi:integrase